MVIEKVMEFGEVAVYGDYDYDNDNEMEPQPQLGEQHEEPGQFFL
jgi:hypothetical protein